MTSKEQRRREWISRITAYKASGLTMNAWCAENHITKDQLRYWLRKTKQTTTSTVAPASPVRWAPLTVDDTPIASAAAVIVRMGQVSIELHPGFDAKLLREVVQALAASC